MQNYRIKRDEAKNIMPNIVSKDVSEKLKSIGYFINKDSDITTEDLLKELPKFIDNFQDIGESPLEACQYALFRIKKVKDLYSVYYLWKRGVKCCESQNEYLPNALAETLLSLKEWASTKTTNF